MKELSPDKSQENSSKDIKDLQKLIKSHNK